MQLHFSLSHFGFKGGDHAISEVWHALNNCGGKEDGIKVWDTQEVSFKVIAKFTY